MWRPALIAVVLLAAAAPGASADSSFTQFGQGWQPLVPDRASALIVSGAVHVDRDGGEVSVSVADPEGGDRRVTITVPGGKRLRRGVYTDAEARGGCQSVEARAEVRDVALAPDGTPTRLWLLYEDRCRDMTMVYGEVRVNMPAPAAVPSIVRWGAQDRGAHGAAVPVTFSGQVTGVRVTGSAAAQFPIAEDGCSGQATPTCQVWVRFRPRGSGTRRAALTATLADGTTRAVPLQGFAHGGRTSATIDGKRLAPPAAKISAVVSFDGVRFEAHGRDTRWDVSFRPPAGRRLIVGRHYVMSRTAAQPELKLVRNGLECEPASASFTITTLRGRGEPTAFGATFSLRCRGQKKTIRGRVGWRERDRTKPAPWIAR